MWQGQKRCLQHLPDWRKCRETMAPPSGGHEKKEQLKNPEKERKRHKKDTENR